MKRLSDKLIAITIFFSMAIIFRTNISGVTVYYYQISGMLLITTVLLELLINKVKLSKKSVSIISLYFLFVFVCIFSYFGLKIFTDNTINQYFKGISVLILDIFIVFSSIVYLNINKVNISKVKNYFHTSFKILVVYGILQGVLFAVGFNTNEALTNLLNLNPPYTINTMGVFIRISGLTWDANFYAFQLLLFIFSLTKENTSTSSTNPKQNLWISLSIILLLLTFSRSAILGLIIFLLINNIGTHLSKKKLKTSIKIVVFIGLISLVLITSFYDVLMPIIYARFGFLFSDQYVTNSTLLRFSYFDIAFELISTNPIGIGYGNYSEYAQVTFGNSFAKLHNSFLQLGVEAGILAAILHFFILKKMIVDMDNISNKKYKCSILISILTISLFYDQTLYLFTHMFFLQNIVVDKNTLTQRINCKDNKMKRGGKI